jgi:hypothetical protein
MSKLFVLVIILPLIFIGCNQSKEKDSDKNDNVLLAKEVKVTSPINIDNVQNPEWTASLNRKLLFDDVVKKLMSENSPLKAYVPYGFEYSTNQFIMKPKDISDKMNWTENDRSTNNLKEIMFYEKWQFDINKLKLKKDIIGWCPIRVYNRDEKQLKKLIFDIYPKSFISGKKIADNIIYEIPWSFEYPTNSVGFDKLGFFKFIIDGIKSGEIIAYDPIYLVDKSKRQFTSNELAKYIGEDLVPIIINISISSLLFVEDWYFDENNFSIQKDVKSFAFVQENYDPVSGESSKKILFFIFPKE